MSLEEFNKLLNITKTYKHAPPKLEASISFEGKYIASKLALSDRIQRLAKTPAYITLKDHKRNFHISTSCRLINLLYVLIMSRMRFRVNSHSIVA